jgi:predicted metal-dependent HD superfamily phosphohydrolase
MLKIGFEPSQITILWKELVQKYTSKSRHYHNLKHLEEMIVCFEQYLKELTHPNEVLFSIFYHDYVYSATKKDNELKSAKFALKLLKNNTFLDQNLVYELIMATKLHQQHTISDGNWLIDFDLKILSKDWEQYQIYCQQIRKEYRIYPNFMYNPGRKKALEHFLENEFIFRTETFRSLYEEKARTNIKKEISLVT